MPFKNDDMDRETNDRDEYISCGHLPSLVIQFYRDTELRLAKNARKVPYQRASSRFVEK